MRRRGRLSGYGGRGRDAAVRVGPAHGNSPPPLTHRDPEGRAARSLAPATGRGWTVSSWWELGGWGARRGGPSPHGGNLRGGGASKGSLSPHGGSLGGRGGVACPLMGGAWGVGGEERRSISSAWPEAPWLGAPGLLPPCPSPFVMVGPVEAVEAGEGKPGQGEQAEVGAVASLIVSLNGAAVTGFVTLPQAHAVWCFSAAAISASYCLSVAGPSSSVPRKLESLAL